MTWAAVSVVAVLAAAGAAAWPLLRPQVTSTGLTPAARADWVNRLFALAADADAAGKADVAEAARALVTALVGQAEPVATKKGR